MKDDIDEEVRGMKLSPLNGAMTKLTFRFFLLKNAYSREGIEQLAVQSRFGACEFVQSGIGFELRLTRSA